MIVEELIKEMIDGNIFTNGRGILYWDNVLKRFLYRDYTINSTTVYINDFNVIDCEEFEICNNQFPYIIKLRDSNFLAYEKSDNRPSIVYDFYYNEDKFLFYKIIDVVDKKRKCVDANSIILTDYKVEINE